MLGRWRASERLHACVDRKKMAVIAEEQTPPSSTPTKNPPQQRHTHEAATTFTNIGTCMSIVSETSEIILSAFEGVSIVILARLSIKFKWLSVLGMFYILRILFH